MLELSASVELHVLHSTTQWLYKDLWWSNVAVKRPLSRPPTYFDARERDYIVFQTGFDGWAIFLRLVCFFPCFVYLPPSINNNFISRGHHIWHEYQSNIWSSDTKTYMRLIITKQWKIFTVCTEQVRFPYIEHAVSGIPNPTRLAGEAWFIQAQNLHELPHVVREW